MAKRLRRIAIVLAVLVGLLVAASAGQSQPAASSQAAGPASGPPDLEPALKAQKRHTDRLLANPDVVGTGVGFAEDGQPAVKIFTKRADVAGLPTTLDGVPVVVEVTGELTALKVVLRPSPPGKGPGGGGGVDPTSTFTRPVPIGVSTGNAGECSAGTIGARVKAGANVYALSNNHVYALENQAPIGSNVLQPGLYDTGCVFDSSKVIGTLADFEPIVFSTSASNTIDAAIAASTTANLGNATPSNGYGTPSSAVVSATVGQAVQKYGRTTALTQGTITAVSVIVNVGYSSGTARFVDQILVQSRKPFVKAGDSGSLVVTDPGRNPVGLLFAGDSSGKFAVANRIDLVLARFVVTVDGS